MTSSTRLDDRYDEPDHLRDQLRRLLRYRTTIALGVALGLLGGVLLVVLRAGNYTSTGEVLVRSTVDPFSTFGVSIDNQVSMGTEQEVARSATVAARAARTLREPSRAEALLEGLRVSNPPDTQILRFEYTAGTAKRAARVTNAFLDAYLADRKERTAAAVTRMTGGLEQQVAVLAERPKSDPAASATVRDQITVLQKRISDLRARDTSAGDIVRRGEPPAQPAGPGPIALLGVSLLGGLLVGLVLAWLRSTLEPRVRSVGEAQEALGAPVLGLLPDTAQGGDLLRVGRAGGGEAEAYRALAFRLRHGKGQSVRGTLLVVAPKHNGDAEAAAVNLAAAFAEFGDDVLLVDATAATPCLAARLPLVSDSAGADAEQAGPRAGRVVVEAGAAGRFALVPDRRGTTADDCPASPVVARVLPSAESATTALVVTRPLLEHTDGLAVAQRVAGVLVVAGLNETRRDELLQVCELIGLSGGRVVGAALVTHERRSRLRASLDGLFRRWRTRPAAATPDVTATPDVAATPGAAATPEAALADGAGDLPASAPRSSGATKEDKDATPHRAPAVREEETAALPKSSSAQDDTLTTSHG